MKTNFRIGESIVIDKPGILNGASGKVIEHNSDQDTIYKPLKVMLDESHFTVALEYFEVKSAEKTEVIKAPENVIAAIEPERKKRKYTKKSEPKEVKPKRKYQKKIKL